jgi:hypothetical protein
MSNITPAWVVLGDSVIKQYYRGEISREEAEEELENLGVPLSMKERLDNLGSYAKIESEELI